MSERTTTAEPITIDAPIEAGENAVSRAPRTAGQAVAQTLSLLDRAIAAGHNDPAYLREVIGMQRDLIQIQRETDSDDSVKAFNRALHGAQAMMPRVVKHGVISLGTGKGSIPFAKWEDVDAVLRPLQKEFGFSVTFSEIAVTEFGTTWEATHRHILGYSQTNRITLARDSGPGRNAVQSSGSTSSYAKRYLVENFFNIVREDEDDDGKKGGARFITTEQVAQLQTLLKDTKTQESVFVQRVFESDEIRSLDEIPAGKFETAFNALMRKKTKMTDGGAQP